MTHYAALPAGIPTRAWSDTEGALDAIVALKPVAPAGTRFVYSDVDFIVLGEIVRRVSGQPLETYAAKNIFQPLGMRDTTFRPSASLRDRIAPADLEGGELRWGEVQDPIAYRMGGVAGHAGVFTTADDLTKFAQMMLAGGKDVLKPASVAAMTTAAEPARRLRHARPRLGHRFALRRVVRAVLLDAAPTATPAIPARRSGSIPRPRPS